MFRECTFEGCYTVLATLSASQSPKYPAFPLMTRIFLQQLWNYSGTGKRTLHFCPILRIHGICLIFPVKHRIIFTLLNRVVSHFSVFPLDPIFRWFVHKSENSTFAKIFDFPSFPVSLISSYNIKTYLYGKIHLRRWEVNIFYGEKYFETSICIVWCWELHEIVW